MGWIADFFMSDAFWRAVMVTNVIAAVLNVAYWIYSERMNTRRRG